MTTQINIPNHHISVFIEKCEEMQIIYHQIEARESNTRYEIKVSYESQIYYLGVSIGMTIAHRNAMNTIDEVYGK